MKNSITLFLFFLLSVSCANHQSATDSTVTDRSVIIKDFTFTNTYLVDTLVFKDCQIVFLETNDQSILSGINRVYKDEDRIFILDKSLNKLCVFNTRGDYQFHLHHIGEGPHEYISLIDFALDTERREIILLCDRPYKIMKFDYNGKFISEYSMPDLFRYVVVQSGFMYCNRSAMNKTELERYELAITDISTGSVENRLLTIDGVENTLFHTGSFLTQNSSVYYTRRFDHAVYEMDGEKVYKKYDFDFGKFSVPSSMMKEDANTLREACNEHQYIFSITDFVENDHYLMFNTNQAICVYDKRTHSFSGFQGILNTSVDIGNNSFYSVGNDENSVMSKIDPSFLHRIGGLSPERPNPLSLMKHIDPDDNPILLFYQFRD